MTRQERAKQFTAFDAMKGLSEALRDREERHSRVERHDISAEQQEINSEIFMRLKKGMKVRLECYSCFHDVTKIGRIGAVSYEYRYLVLDGEKIFFSDIYDILISDI